MLKINVSVTEAADYFAGRLHTDSWDVASAADRQKAISQATRQIQTLNFQSRPRPDIITAAVCEQALFLLNMTVADLERYRARQLGTTYRQAGDASENYHEVMSILSPDVDQVLLPYIGQWRRTGAIR